MSEIDKPESLKISFKLNGENYPLWARLMKISVGGKGKLKHLTGDPAPPKKEAADYTKWEENDLLVFSWILNNIEEKFINSVSEYSTAKEVWKALETTYGQAADPVQTFELYNQASRQIQGEMPLEEFWTTLQGYWKAIDRLEPNPMKCDPCIGIHHSKTQNQRLFQFLGGLHIRHESIKRDILKMSPWPSVEIAYSIIRKEIARLKILKPTFSEGNSSSTGGDIGVGLAIKQQSYQRNIEGQTDKKTISLRSKGIITASG